MKTWYYRYALGVIAAGSLMACSNDIDNPVLITPNVSTTNSMLVRNPEIKAWAGKYDFSSGSTRAVEVEAPADLSQDEIDAVKAFFDSNTGGSYIDISSLSDWKNYFVQNVSSDNMLKNTLTEYGMYTWEVFGDNNDQIVNLKIWNVDPSVVLGYLNTDEYNNSDKKVDIDIDPDPQLVINHAIKDFSFESKGYTLQGVGNNWEKKTYEGRINCGGKPNGMSNAYRIAKINGYEDAVYVALFAYVPVYDNNGFWNRIIKLTKTEIPEENEGEGDNGENGNEGNGDNTGNGGTGNSDFVTYYHDNEVEVNLSLLDTHQDKYSIEDLITKLSIHARYPHDIKVRIPVPTELLVPADDLDIVLSHKELLESYGKDNQASFLVGSYPVSLTVNFENAILDCAGVPTDGYFIEVQTNGINQEVISYCIDNYGDGMNFEVYNYYQFNKTLADGSVQRSAPNNGDLSDLKGNWLDSSTIEFGYGNWYAFSSLEQYPYYFINSFHSEDGKSINSETGFDCYVKVISNQNDGYENFYKGAHLNGSNNNLIYVRNDIWGTDKQDVAHREVNYGNN